MIQYQLMSPGRVLDDRDLKNEISSRKKAGDFNEAHCFPTRTNSWRDARDCVRNLLSNAVMTGPSPQTGTSNFILEQ